MKKCLLLFVVLLSSFAAAANPILIKNFAVKENPFGKDELAIVATDTAGIIQEDVNGTFKFSINGFDEDLAFEHGTAFYHRKLDKSSFIYVKHSDDAGSSSILYYVYRQNSKLTPIRISWIILIVIPLYIDIVGLYVQEADYFSRYIVLRVLIFQPPQRA